MLGWQKNRTVQIDGEQVKFQLVRFVLTYPIEFGDCGSHGLPSVCVMTSNNDPPNDVVGHSWTRAIPDNYEQLLPWLARDNDRL